MQPEQTNLASVSERDAAARLLRSPNPAIAVRADASSEKAERAVPKRSFFGLLKQYWREFQERCRRQTSRTNLHELSERNLTDIGVRRDEIDSSDPRQAIDRLRHSNTDFWPHSRDVI